MVLVLYDFPGQRELVEAPVDLQGQQTDIAVDDAMRERLTVCGVAPIQLHVVVAEIREVLDSKDRLGRRVAQVVGETGHLARPQGRERGQPSSQRQAGQELPAVGLRSIGDWEGLIGAVD